MAKIAFLITDITGKGGIERVTRNLANSFSQRGYDVTILSCFKKNKEISYDLNPNVRIVYLLQICYSVKQSIFNRLRLLIKAGIKLKGYLRNNEPNIIISQAFLPSFLLFFAKTKAKVLVSEHFKYELYSKSIIRFRNHIYKKIGTVITLTNADADKFKKVGIKAIAIPNMLSFPIQSNNYNGKRMISIGRLHPQKGYDLMIKSMIPIFSNYPDWKLDIYGEGDDRDDLTKLIEDSGLKNNIFLKGYTKDIKKEIRNSSICLVTSRYEGFPMSIVESLALGTPVIAFDCPEGPKELLKNGAGILVKYLDVVEFSKSVESLIKNEDKRESCRENGYRNATQYLPEVIISKWECIFRS